LAMAAMDAADATEPTEPADDTTATDPEAYSLMLPCEDTDAIEINAGIASRVICREPWEDAVAMDAADATDADEATPAIEPELGYIETDPCEDREEEPGNA